jgi:hypothetical protein
MIAFAFVVVTLIVCGTLVTRWCLKFVQAQSEAEKEWRKIEEDVEEEEGDEDPALLSVNHLDGWDEIIFNGRRYRKCLSYGSPAYSMESCGWVHYPEGTPLTSSEWMTVNAEYDRRRSLDKSARVAIAARAAWNQRDPDETPLQRTLEEELANRRERERERELEHAEREAELDRRVEEAREATRREEGK